jgi:nucleotidyltransferase/DNA polymerase involved in DNA repair
MTSRIILHIDLDDFFAAVEQRDNPALRGRPVVVGADPQGGHGRGVVSTCSYEARAFGIHSAMPISAAYRLCPRAVFLPVSMRKYLDVSRRVFEILDEFTPLVEPVSVDEAFLDISGCLRLLGSPEAAGRRLKARVLAETGLTASIGIAPVKVAAKIASDLCKPDGLLVISGGELRTFLMPLPVDKLWGVGPKTGAALARLGIRTIGDLAAFPPEILSRHLGSAGEALWALANGLDPRAVVTEQPVQSVSHEHTFPEDTRDAQELLSTLLLLSEKVSRRLRRLGLKGRTVTVKVRLKSFKTYTRARTLSGGTNYVDAIYPCAAGLVKEFLALDEAVRLVGVKVGHFEEAFVRDSLFTEDEDHKREGVHRVMDEIKDRFGDGAIFRGLPPHL